MANEKYVAYVSTYTRKDNRGIKIFDVDLKNGRMTEKGTVEITNSSYVSVSHNGKYLYSITDAGVEAFRILEDGLLELINMHGINGMRGCYVSTDYTDKYLFVAGFHDGKLTVLSLGENGEVLGITDEVYHQGFGGSVADRNFRPHINCARMTHDNRFLLVADQGMDHVNVYSFDPEFGRVRLVDIIRSTLESAPRHIRISEDGRFIYILHEQKCYIDVYKYEFDGKLPRFEKIQTEPVIRLTQGGTYALCAFSFSRDYKYLLTTIAGDNSAAIYDIDQETGLITKNFVLPIAGEYPKDADMFPGNEFLVSLNHESNTLTFFRIDLEKHTMIMNGPAIKISTPNCIAFHKLSK